MPLRVKTLAEPFSEHAKGEEPILAHSEEYRRLRKDLKRYTNGEILGRSYLIGGHRGSGKTMMVHQAIENLIRESQQRPNRPLFVRLHGPDLLPPATPEEKKPETTPEPTAADDAPAKEASDAAKALSSKADATKKAAVEEARKRTADELELEAVLIQMVKALYRDVSTEYRRCFREAILKLPDGIIRNDLLEVSAQFDFELTDYVRPERLRDFWQRIDGFRRGILFSVDRSAYQVYLAPKKATAASNEKPATPMVATDIGFQEILVLSYLSEAFRITSGKLEDISRRLSSDKDTRSSSISTAYELKNLLAPVAGLLSGGFVGISIGSTNPFAAVLLGLVTGGIVSFAFSYKSERTRNRENTLESVFTKDRSVTTLSSVVPLLVVRLKQVGLAPIFVIDELDKVQNLEKRMTNLVRHLKFLVTENSFSCFLVDRRYFSYLNRQSTQSAYAREYTYFSDRLLVLYSPSELRDFVTKALEAVSSNPPYAAVEATKNDQEEVEKISYALLFRARMHPIDLRRQLDHLTTRRRFTMAECFPSPRYRFEILIQVAIEWLLDGDDVKSRIAGQPDYRQVIYDTLYYVPRLWEDAGSDEPKVPGFHDYFKTGDKERKPGLFLDTEKFAEYLESRIAAEDEVKTNQPAPTGRKTQPKKEARLSGKDFAFLMEKVRDLLRFLCHPDELVNEIRRTPRTVKPNDTLLSEIPQDPDLRLIIQKDKEPKYRWLYNYSGSTLETREVNTIKAEVKDAIIYIRDFIGELDALGLSGDLLTLAELKIIPRHSELKVRVTPALHRLEELRGGGDEYTDMIADRDVVREFATTLAAFEPNINAALLGAAVFAPEVSLSKPTPGAMLAVALKQLSDALRLTGIPEDLGKLESLLISVPGPMLNYRQDLSEVITSVNQLLAASKATDEAANSIIADAWNRYRDRFSKHFQEGTTKFDTDYFELFTLVRKKGPGVELASDFSTIPARTWSTLLLRSLSGNDVPRWLSVAAALELGMFELAQKLAAHPEASDALLSRWVEDAMRLAPTDTTRTNAIIITLEKMSPPDSWQPSTENGAAIFGLPGVTSLIEELKRLQVVTSPSDYQLQLVAIELPTDVKTLSKVAGMPPARALATISSTPLSKDLEELLNNVTVSYFLTKSVTRIVAEAVPIVMTPKTIDELIRVSLSSLSPATTT